MKHALKKNFFSGYEETPVNLRDKFEFRVVRGMREVCVVVLIISTVPL